MGEISHLEPYLTDKFFEDLLRLCFHDESMLSICSKHLEYHYIPVESYRYVWKEVDRYYKTYGLIPSFGNISQIFSTSSDLDISIRDCISDIAEIGLPAKTTTLKLFEAFIKDSKMFDAYGKFTEAYKEGKKDKAQAIIIKAAESLSTTSLIEDTKACTPVFKGFDARHDERYYQATMFGDNGSKIPFGIDPLDYVTFGGMDVKDTFCYLSKSGGGKTKLLRYMGVNAARRGHNVLHIQAEGSEEECLAGYDATWSACLMSDIRKGDIDSERYHRLTKVVKGIRSKGGEIYVYSFEQFDSASMSDVRDIFYDLSKSVKIGMVIIDYLELLDPSDGRKYAPDQERFRRIAIAEKMKNLALEGSTRVATATQANSVAPKLLNDDTFVLTRHNISECKGLANPFSYFVTGNQTREEYEEDKMRLFIDKLRNYKAEYVIKICQAYDRNRFFDRKRTNELYPLDEQFEMPVDKL